MTPDKYEKARGWIVALARDLGNRSADLADFVVASESKGRAMRGCPNERSKGCVLLRESEFAASVLDAYGELRREKESA